MFSFPGISDVFVLVTTSFSYPQSYRSRSYCYAFSGQRNRFYYFCFQTQVPNRDLHHKQS
jgi:hypothetical protein